MKRKWIVFIGCMLYGLAACKSGESQVVKSVKDTVKIYLEHASDYYYDRTWMKDYKKRVFHPNINALGIKVSYSGINEEITLEKGTFLFSNAEITEVKESQERVDFTKADTDKEKTFFVTVTFNVLGVINSSGLIEQTSQSRKIKQVFILAIDKNDQKYKIIDFYPSITDRNFVGLNYVRKFPEKFQLSLDAIQQLPK